jgi:hypothetical protein
MLSATKSRYAGKKIILYCFSALAFLILVSCSASELSSGDSIQSQYFNISIPYGSGNWWKLNQDSEFKAGERIWLHKGFLGGGMFAADYPIEDVLVLRKTIPDSIVDLDEKMLRSRLDEIVLAEVKKVVDSLWSRDIVKNFYCHYFIEEDDEYSQFHYSVYWTDVMIYTEGATPDTVECYFGDGIGQFEIYLPKYYNEYKSYYIIIYNLFLRQVLNNKLGSWVREIECIEDSIKN